MVSTLREAPDGRSWAIPGFALATLVLAAGLVFVPPDETATGQALLVGGVVGQVGAVVGGSRGADRTMVTGSLLLLLAGLLVAAAATDPSSPLGRGAGRAGGALIVGTVWAGAGYLGRALLARLPVG
ncbi:hypothetical protein [Haloglomus litoreum]|uniref:hypothetical protein n=1 Tax=Haloglomus litoreum TaxID=3034026 RepID=UPI0023E87066|nr:hypothetical protein [Haloglomus sp. DT116]